jgi:hypothetical protein
VTHLLEPVVLAEYLHSEKLLTDYQLERIKAPVIVSDQTRAMLAIIPSRGPSMFDHFLSALLCKYPDMKDKLIM